MTSSTINSNSMCMCAVNEQCSCTLSAPALECHIHSNKASIIGHGIFRASAAMLRCSMTVHQLSLQSCVSCHQSHHNLSTCGNAGNCSISPLELCQHGCRLCKHERTTRKEQSECCIMHMTAFHEFGTMQRLKDLPGSCKLHDYGIDQSSI